MKRISICGNQVFIPHLTSRDWVTGTVRTDIPPCETAPKLKPFMISGSCRETADPGANHLPVPIRIFFLLSITLPAFAQSQPSHAPRGAAHPRSAAQASFENQGYVGSAACAGCHATIHRQWVASLHRKMLQPATAQTVVGDFSHNEINVHNQTYGLERREGKFFIVESYLAGKPWEHTIDYTLGDRRVQQYLTKLPDGRIILLPPTWDNVQKKWTHDFDIHNPEEDASTDIQLWNKTCYGCHVSQEKKNFDVQHLGYRTTWQELGIDCEACHGPGKQHVAKASMAKLTKSDPQGMLKGTVVNPAHLNAALSTTTCAGCHSYNDTYVDGFRAGSNYYDYFLPALEYRLPQSDNSPYWPDGRPRWLSNEVGAFWQSQCFLKGEATCSTCHSPHEIDVARDPLLRPDANAACIKCHATVAANVSAHTHHAEKSAGSSCVECHMPALVVGVNGSTMRDHSISVPVPENTIRHNIPNACNACHSDQNAEWAVQQLKNWHADTLRQKFIRRADAFTGARQSDSSAVPALLQILNDAGEPSFIRANAAGYLAGFPNDPTAYDAVFSSLSDGDPLVRATAASAIRPRAAQREALAPKLVSLLRDPLRTVSASAAIQLLSMGVRDLPGEDGDYFRRAKDVYRSRAELNADDAQQQFAAGRFFFLAGDMNSSIAAFRSAMQIDDTISAQYDLARALATKGDTKTARQILTAIPQGNPQYQAAQRFLVEMQQNELAVSTDAGAGADKAQGLFLEGQVQYQDQNYGPALALFEQALRLAPQAEWTTKAQAYRAICLEKLSRTQEAEAAMQSLSGNPAARQNVDLQLAYAELLYDTGRPQDSLKKIDDLLAAVPEAAMAYFWRAKVLLQLQRLDDAAVAAERAESLQPNLPLTHNLLMKIYQTQGRAKEAAEQAQWLRDYQRRLESH